MEPAASAVLSEAVKAIVEKPKDGRKLPIEDLFLLYLGVIHEEQRAIRVEIAEFRKGMTGLREEIYSKFDAINARLDEVSGVLTTCISYMVN